MLRKIVNSWLRHVHLKVTTTVMSSSGCPLIFIYDIGVNECDVPGCQLDVGLVVIWFDLNFSWICFFRELLLEFCDMYILILKTRGKSDLKN